MRTAFGKHLVKIRVDKDILLKDMAELLGVTPQYVSAVERGRSPASERLISRICKALELDDTQCQELHIKAGEAKNEVTIKYDPEDEIGKKLAIEFARNFNSLSEDGKQNLLLRLLSITTLIEGDKDVE